MDGAARSPTPTEAVELRYCRPSRAGVAPDERRTWASSSPRTSRSTSWPTTPSGPSSRAFRDQLLDSWFVIPSVAMREATRDREADIVLLHHELGVVLIEVKGHRMAIKDGTWVGQEGTPLDPQPIDQAKENAYALRRRLRKASPTLEHLRIEYGVALPNTRSMDGHLPPDVVGAQVLMAPDLQRGQRRHRGARPVPRPVPPTRP